MAREKLGERMSVILDDETRQAIADVMQITGEKVAATLLRKAIRAGLPLLKPGVMASILRLDGNLSRFVDELAKEYGKTRDAILAEAVKSGIRAVETRNLIEKTKAESPEGEDMGKAMEQWHALDIYPEKREAKKAMRERGQLEIQLNDLLRHCPEAKRRKELIEKHHEVMKKRYGSGPLMWGSGVTTEHLEQNIKIVEDELAKGEGPGPEEKAWVEQLESIEKAEPPYSVKRIMKLPTETVKPANPKKSAKKKSSK